MTQSCTFQQAGKHVKMTLGEFTWSCCDQYHMTAITAGHHLSRPKLMWGLTLVLEGPAWVLIRSLQCPSGGLRHGLAA